MDMGIQQLEKGNNRKADITTLMTMKNNSQSKREHNDDNNVSNTSINPRRNATVKDIPLEILGNEKSNNGIVIPLKIEI